MRSFSCNSVNTKLFSPEAYRFVRRCTKFSHYVHQFVRRCTKFSLAAGPCPYGHSNTLRRHQRREQLHRRGEADAAERGGVQDRVGAVGLRSEGQAFSAARPHIYWLHSGSRTPESWSPPCPPKCSPGPHQGAHQVLTRCSPRAHALNSTR